MDNRPIGIFDSGIGGLTVFSEVMKALPYEDIVYFGDTARVPYGSKSKETITKFSRQIVEFLLTKNVKAIIIACNTSSSNCYSQLIKEFDVPIIEVISPGVRAGLETTKNNIIGVIGTESTIGSGAYENKLKEGNAEIKVYSRACPLFVPLVEEGWTRNNVATSTCEIYLQELIDKDIDSLILGCTHYPMLIDCIKKVVGNINVINPATYTANDMKTFLKDNNMLKENTTANYKFYVSDNTKKFNKTCNLLFSKSYEAEKIDMDIG